MAKQVMKSIIVKGSPSTVYALWSDIENFPRFMTNVKKVRKLDANKSEWTVAGPLGTDVTWTAEMTREEEDKRIAWNSKDDDGSVTTSGQVTFNQLPNDQTEVTVLLQYGPPGGRAGEFAADLLANPLRQLEEDLRNFKSFAEATNK